MTEALLAAGLFIPHGHCYLWQPRLVGLHVLSDGLIALAYGSIPATLTYFVRRRPDLPFGWIFWLFISFIISCGITHGMAIWTLWHPDYWLSGALKAASAGVSMTTAVLLVPLVPRALALPSPSQLEIMNQALLEEVRERQQAERALKQLNEQLELRVQERTAKLTATVTQLEQEICDRTAVETQLIASQQALKKARDRADAASRAKTEFLANISHDIRTPMNAILGFCELLKPHVVSDKAQTYLAAIDHSGKTLLALINDLLDSARLEVNKLELQLDAVNLRQLLDSCQLMFQSRCQAKGLDLIFDIDDDLPTQVMVDELRLQQVITNVLDNAIKFTAQGQITLALKADFPRENSPTENPPSAAPGGQAEKVDLTLTITDTGIGIPLDQQAQIFAPFSQSRHPNHRHHGGTGLGLSIVQRLTNLMGGSIQLTSQVGQGSQFQLQFLGVAIATSPANPQPSPVLPLHLNDLAPAVLLVSDDVPSNLLLIQSYFSDTHHQVLVAETGAATLEICQQQRPDVLLLDLWLTDMDGWQVARSLRQQPSTQDLPILLITASVDPLQPADGASLVRGILGKPLALNLLVQTLAGVLPLRSQQPADCGQISLDPQPQAPIDWVGFNQALSQIAQTLWPEVNATLSLRQVQHFVAVLSDLYQRYPEPQLQTYLDQLQQQVNQFDWSQIPQTIADFPSLYQQHFCVLSPPPD